jgi:hypothetical protein
MKIRGLLAALVLTAALFVSPAKAAIVTLPFSSFGNGAVTVTFDYNEQNGDVKKFVCANASPYDAWFGVFYVDPNTQAETLVYQKTCAANGTTTQVVAGLTLAWDTVDGGLNMGNYQFRARWPN